MNLSEQRASIESLFFSKWDSNKTPVKFDNAVGLVKGSTPVKDETKLDEWCRITIENQSADYAALGRKMVRHTGVVIVTIFTKVNVGTKRARELADSVSEVFASSTDVNMIYYPTQVVNAMQDPNAGLYQVTTQTPFIIDQYL